MARKKARRDVEELAKAADQRASAARIAWLAGVSQAAVSDALASGTCPRNKDGTLCWPDVRAWAVREGRWFARPAASGGDDATMLAHYKALEAKREYEQRIGLLIPRADAEHQVLRYVLAVKAALLALPEQMAAQVANLGAREAAAAIRERVQWICQQHQDGGAAIPPKLEAAIAKLVDEHLGRKGGGG